MITVIITQITDVRQLKRNKDSRQSLSGVQLLSMNVLQTLFQKTIQAGLLLLKTNIKTHVYIPIVRESIQRQDLTRMGGEIDLIHL